MITGRELAAKVKARAAELEKMGQLNKKQGHVAPCRNNFDYSTISEGDKEGLEMILNEIKSK